MDQNPWIDIYILQSLQFTLKGRKYIFCFFVFWLFDFFSTRSRKIWAKRYYHSLHLEPSMLKGLWSDPGTTHIQHDDRFRYSSTCMRQMSGSAKHLYTFLGSTQITDNKHQVKTLQEQSIVCWGDSTIRFTNRSDLRCWVTWLSPFASHNMAKKLVQALALHRLKFEASITRPAEGNLYGQEVTTISCAILPPTFPKNNMEPWTSQHSSDSLKKKQGYYRLDRTATVASRLFKCTSRVRLYAAWRDGLKCTRFGWVFIPCRTVDSCIFSSCDGEQNQDAATFSCSRM